VASGLPGLPDPKCSTRKNVEKQGVFMVSTEKIKKHGGFYEVRNGLKVVCLKEK